MSYGEEIKHFLKRSRILRVIPDKIYLKILYKKVTGKKLNLKNPKTFGEKIQWLKLYDRNPLYTKLVDKYEVRDYIKEQIGEEYLIPLVGGPWNDVEEIDFSSLPDRFVLKCTHDSGSVIVCKDKENFNIEDAKKKLKRGLQINFYDLNREWPYKNVKPRIIAEQYMEDESGYELKDYKVMNFGGVPRFVYVDFGRFGKHGRNLYTTEWEYMDAQIQYPTDPTVKIECPKQIQKMLELAQRLSKGMAHVRTDFYIIGEKIYFGEITFYNGSGFSKFTPEEFGEELGEWITLEK